MGVPLFHAISEVLHNLPGYSGFCGPLAEDCVGQSPGSPPHLTVRVDKSSSQLRCLSRQHASFFQVAVCVGGVLLDPSGLFLMVKVPNFCRGLRKVKFHSEGVGDLAGFSFPFPFGILHKDVE